MVQRSKKETLSLSTILVSQQAKLTFLPPVQGNRRPRDYTPPAPPAPITCAHQQPNAIQTRGYKR